VKRRRDSRIRTGEENVHLELECVYSWVLITSASDLGRIEVNSIVRGYE
jgi:hypothetical protein